jgi:hypothetical protein
MKIVLEYKTLKKVDIWLFLWYIKNNDSPALAG